MTENLAPTRRTVVRLAAWSTPVVIVASASPAFATSHPPVIVPGSIPRASKCPGQSYPGAPFTYVVSFQLTSEPQTFTITSLVINGATFSVVQINIVGNTVHVRSAASSNSADSDGSGTVVYTSNGETFTFPFEYEKSLPDKNGLCELTPPPSS